MEVLLFVEGQLTTMTHLEEVLHQDMQELNDRLEEWDEANYQSAGVMRMFHSAMRMYDSVYRQKQRQILYRLHR